MPQFRQMKDPPFHKFIAFSELDETQNLVPSLAQCPNCGVVHKIKEVGLSDILRKEDAPTLLTVDEIKSNLPEKLIQVLAKYELELHQWMEFKWILDNEDWGRHVVISKELLDGEISGKFIQVIGKDLYRVDSFAREELAG